MQIGVSTETLEVSGGISGVDVKTIRPALTEAGNGVRCGSGGLSSGRFGRETWRNNTVHVS